MAKRYVALMEGIVEERELDWLRAGVTLDDGPCQPAECSRLAPDAPLVAAVAPDGIPPWHSVCEITVHEGRKHQVKRMFAHVGHHVNALHRASFGPLELSGVEPGKWRELDEGERRLLAELLGREE